MLINCSNHPYEKWPEKQKKAAACFGKVLDLPFPEISASADEAEIKAISEDVIRRIIELNPECVMCQGEFTLTFQIVNRLKEARIPVVAACSDRIVVDKVDSEGRPCKLAVFDFVRFRRY